MTHYHFEVPDELVEALVLRRMSNGLWVASATHKFGSVYDNHGQILGPVAPHGVASAKTPDEAMAKAVEDLAKEVAKHLAEQNAVASRVGQYPKLNKTETPLLDIELDL